MKIAALIAGALLCASAAPEVVAIEGPYSTSLPPEKYRATGAAVLHIVTEDELFPACGMERRPGLTLYGCARRWWGAPEVFLPDACEAGEAEFFARIVCHESAHLWGGWSGNHEL